MQKLKIFTSIGKILLTIAVVALVCSVTNAKSLTGAFFNSTISALGNPIGGGDFDPPTAPLFWVEEDTSQVKIDWTSSSSGDATGYRVYRSLDNVSFTQVADLGAVNTYTDTTATANSNYYYKVTAHDASNNENPVGGITAKYAGTMDLVIDDDAQSGDFNSNGTVAVGGTGTWDKYATIAGSGVNVVPSVLQNAVGGDNYSTANPATGQTYTWQTTPTLDGQYDVYVQYICDPSRTIARYDVFAGSTKLNASSIDIYQSRTDGLAASAPCPGQAGTSVLGPQWVKLGNFGFSSQTAKVTVTAQAGEVNILADAVGFRRTGDVDPAPVVKIESPADSNTISGIVQIRGTVTDNNPDHYWLMATQVGGSDVVGFPGTVTATTSFTNQVIYTWDTTGVANGQYLLKLEARDAAGNKNPNLPEPVPSDPESATDSVDWITVTVNNTTPLSYITVQNSPPKFIENRIQNGSFESGLANWNSSGDVSLITGPDGLFAFPQQGSKMVRIGKTTNQGNPARLNILSQQVPAGVRTLGFYYNMFTYDHQGFDDPGFMVFVNDKMVLQRWASEIDRDDPLGSTENLDSSGWQYFGVDLSQYPDGTTLTFAFYAGNDNLNLSSTDPHQTWVYLDNFSTNEAVVNNASLFEIHTQPGHTAKYRIGSDVTTYTGNTFNLTAQPSNQTVYYWSENGSVVEPTNSFHVLHDNVAPEKITDLSGAHLDDNLFKLNWLSPRDDNQFTAPFSRPTNAAGYEIKYATTPIDSNVAWNSPDLKTPTIVTEDGLPFGGYRAPEPEDEQEEYFVRTPDSATDYYFVVRSYDAATNTSLVSNVAHVTLSSPAVVDNGSDIVINEFLPNPTGADDAAKPDGEWVELYNKSSADINVANWVLYDADNSHPLTITASNSDNNLNLADGGETTVPANGRLVVYRNGNALFDLPNVGNGTIRLYNKAIGQPDVQLIDSYVYTAGAEDKSFARVPEGTGDFVDPVPTPGRPNALTTADLTAQVRIWWQEAYNAMISVFDAVNYTNAHFLIEYKYNNGGGEQMGGIQGDIAINALRVDKKNIYFSTCSTNGECVPHQNVIPGSIKLTVTLTGPGIPDRTITQPLTGNWPQ